MSGNLTLKANKRDLLGKLNELRAQGQTPAVIHDHGKDSIHISVIEADLKKVFASAGKHHPVDVDVDGKRYATLIKEITRKPATNRLYHSVFQAIAADEKVTAELPLKVSEDSPAARASLLVLTKVDHIEVEALPKDLIDALEVDVSSLIEVGDKITVADLKVPSTITIKTDLSQTIATVEMPKDQIAEADAALEEQKTTDATTDDEATDSADEAPTADQEATKPDEK